VLHEKSKQEQQKGLDPVEFLARKEKEFIESKTNNLILQKWDLAPEKKSLLHHIAVYFDEYSALKKVNDKCELVKKGKEEVAILNSILSGLVELCYFNLDSYIVDFYVISNMLVHF